MFNDKSLSNAFQNNLLYKATTDYVVRASAYVTDNQKGKVGFLMHVVFKYASLNNISKYVMTIFIFTYFSDKSTV